MHRIRAEILLKRDPVDTAPAEQALQTAIAIAQHQKARSFELRAALALAKLYCSTGRDADAHAVLAPAVEGFPPTRQFPELTEAQPNPAPRIRRLIPRGAEKVRDLGTRAVERRQKVVALCLARMYREQAGGSRLSCQMPTRVLNATSG
jgi:hypothetical protein